MDKNKTKVLAYKYCLDICFSVEWYFNTLRRGDTYTSTSIRSVVIRIGLFASPLPSKYLNKYWIINFILINKPQLYFNQRVKYRTIRSTRRNYCLPFSLNLNELTWNVKESVLYLPSCICVTSTKKEALLISPLVVIFIMLIWGSTQMDVIRPLSLPYLHALLENIPNVIILV